jgi:flavin-binding protein dodecin
VTSVGQSNFEWVVETAADYAIERAKKQKDGIDNLTWGEFVKTSAAKEHLLSSEKNIEKKADKKELSKGEIHHEITDEKKIVKTKTVKKTTAKK